MVATARTITPISVESAGRVVPGCHRSDRCEGRWRRQLANAVRRLVQVGKGDQWIANEVRDVLGHIKRPTQPGPAAVEVMEMPKPRAKEGSRRRRSESK